MLLWSISPTFLVREAPCHQLHHLDASCKQSWKTALQLDGHMEMASEAVWPLSDVLVAESDTLLLLPHSYWPGPGLLICPTLFPSPPDPSAWAACYSHTQPLEGVTQSGTASLVIAHSLELGGILLSWGPGRGCLPPQLNSDFSVAFTTAHSVKTPEPGPKPFQAQNRKLT